MTDLPELLPCPFCGGEAFYGDEPQGHFVNCLECVASVQTLISHNLNRNEVAAAWNTRAAPADAQIMAHQNVVALVEALQNIRELNTAEPDGAGLRWVHSDLIDQEIHAALSNLKGGAE